MRAFLSILLLTVFTAAAAPQADVVARTPDVPVAETPPLVAWRDLVDKPCRWLGRKVRVRMQYESELADWNAYLTRFGRGQFDALRGWSDEQFPWVEADFKRPEALLFVRKGSASQHDLDEAHTFSRYEFTVAVREVFLDTPWAEIVDVRPMAEEVREATVIHAARAIELMAQGAWQLAAYELDVALEAPLPDAAAIELKRLSDVCAAAVKPSAK